MKTFLVFTLPHEEDWGDHGVALAAGALKAQPPGSVVVIDNDSSPELETMIRSVAETIGAPVHRIERTPKWKIASDIFTGQAAAGCTEPVLIASAADPRVVAIGGAFSPDGLLGPAGDVSEDFVYTSNPSELMATVFAKTRGWAHADVFAPAVYVAARSGVAARQIPPLGNLATMFGVAGHCEPVLPAEDRPAPVHPALVAFYDEHLGPEARDFLVRLQSASQIADDFVDGDLRPEWRSDAMRELLEALLLRVPNDPFYQRHKPVLEEAVAQCISVWALSNELVVDHTLESRMWCFVQRASFQMVVWRVAVIVGGLDHARRVLSTLQQLQHGPHGGAKRFQTWLEETRAKSVRG